MAINNLPGTDLGEVEVSEPKDRRIQLNTSGEVTFPTHPPTEGPTAQVIVNAVLVHIVQDLSSLKQADRQRIIRAVATYFNMNAEDL